MSDPSKTKPKVSSGSAVGVNQKKNDGSISTPTTAYGFFKLALKTRMMQANSNTLTVTDFSKQSSQLWKRLTTDQRKPYVDMAKKDPNAPKKPLTSFFLFCQDFRPTVQEDHPHVPAPELSKELGRLWRSLSEDQKAAYQAKYEKDKKRYEEEMKDYNGGNPPSKRRRVNIDGSSSSVDHSGGDSLSVGQSVTVSAEYSENVADYSTDYSSGNE